MLPRRNLFFALKTKRNDGHKYIPDLYERGVRNFVVSELPENKEAYTAANFLQLANPLKGLQKLAEKHREQFLIPVVGITGSNGKTVVKEWLYQLLSRIAWLPALPAVIIHKSECRFLYG